MSVLTDSNGNVYVSNGSAITYSGGSGATEPYREDTVTLNGTSGEYEVTGCVLHGYNVIPGAMFSGYSYLTSVDLSDNNIGAIENSAFYECSSLTSINIPSGVAHISSYAFQNCTGLTSVTIPNTVTSIGQYAFSSCSALTSINIPSSVENIIFMAFYACGSLSSITFNRTSVPTFGTDVFKDIASTGTVTVPTGMIALYKSALESAGFPTTGWTYNEQ